MAKSKVSGGSPEALKRTHSHPKDDGSNGHGLPSSQQPTAGNESEGTDGPPPRQDRREHGGPAAAKPVQAGPPTRGGNGASPDAGKPFGNGELAERIKELVRLAQDQGYLTYGDINDAIPD